MKYKFKSKDKSELNTLFNSKGSMDYMLKDNWYIELDELPKRTIQTIRSRQPECGTRDYSWAIFPEDLIPYTEEPKIGDMVIGKSGHLETTEATELLVILPDTYRERYVCRSPLSDNDAVLWAEIRLPDLKLATRADIGKMVKIKLLGVEIELKLLAVVETNRTMYVCEDDDDTGSVLVLHEAYVL